MDIFSGVQTKTTLRSAAKDTKWLPRHQFDFIHELIRSVGLDMLPSTVIHICCVPIDADNLQKHAVLITEYVFSKRFLTCCAESSETAVHNVHSLATICEYYLVCSNPNVASPNIDLDHNLGDAVQWRTRNEKWSKLTRHKTISNDKFHSSIEMFCLSNRLAIRGRTCSPLTLCDCAYRKLVFRLVRSRSTALGVTIFCGFCAGIEDTFYFRCISFHAANGKRYWKLIRYWHTFIWIQLLHEKKNPNSGK